MTTTSDVRRALRHRWGWLVVTLLLGVGSAVLLTALTPRVYQATAEVFVGTPQTATASSSDLALGGQFARERVKSYTEVIASPLVTESVVARLGLAMSPAELASGITARVPLDTVVIEISVQQSSAEQATQVTNAVMERFIEVATQLETPAGALRSAVKLSVVQSAEGQVIRVHPSPTLNLAIGAALGLLAGAALMVLLDRRAGTPQQERSATGMIPSDRL